MPVMSGDISQNLALDATDIDLVYANLGSTDPLFDLDGDMDADRDDVVELVQNVMKKEFGDVDLDGDVDTSDLTNAIINFTSANGSGKTWSQGDTDGDGDVDTADLTTAIINFTSAMSGNSEHDANKAVVFVDPTTPAPTSAVNTATNEHSLSNTPHFASTKKSTQQSTVDDVNRSATQSTRFNARDSRIHLSLLDHAFDEFDGA